MIYKIINRLQKRILRLLFFVYCGEIIFTGKAKGVFGFSFKK